ncbi:NAD(P)-binding protein [Apiospora kogelbergensis]|uniref:NAD(P)-binding protein n=1 Tax=Apiospora kogelbergensis TaxID=1337665 RepID=A0AAW0R5G8_9PEZI
MADPRVQNLDNFTPTQHQKPGPTLLSALDNTTNDGSSNSMQHYHVCIIGARLQSPSASGEGPGRTPPRSRSRARRFPRTAAVHVRHCDVASADSVADLARFVRATLAGGRLDVLALNSGYAGAVQLRITDGAPGDGEWARAFAVNVQGTYHAAHHFVPLLLASGRGAKAFVVVGSMAQTRIVEHLACQFGAEDAGGLLAVAVHPGAVLTESAARNTPDEFKPYLIDDPELCGAFCVWLTRNASSMRWLNGRLVSATWDPDELLGKKEEIINGDLLKYEAITRSTY